MKAIAIGIGATALMDLWHLLLRLGFGVPSLNYCVLGRLLRAPRECLAGWTAHYTIGIALAAGFVHAVPEQTLTSALAYGAATVVFPFVILHPALGLGVAASRAPRPFVARLKSVATHVVFGLGLYWTAWLLGAWPS